jgi:quercetin dioxygenase-like cupin family protein
MVYVLKGWIETELDGQGAIVMKEGSCWIQPSGIRHAVLGYSDDCEVLEIVLPADFKTVELE